jgi:DNA-binding NarL/FixJ family response regulator
MHDGADHSEATEHPTSRRVNVLVYASDPDIRQRVIRALGENPTADLTLDVTEAGAAAEAVALLDAGAVDLAILDGEAAPTGGMGLARQIKDEIDSPPPVVLLVARRDDAWLATWSRAEAVVPHPVDAVTLAEAVTSLLAGAPTGVATAS